MDREKIKQGVRLILEGIGEDPEREGLLETPDRIARMYEEIFGGLRESAAPHLERTFPMAEAGAAQGLAVSCGMVLEKDITLYSTCEHHLMPFYGKVHIAYLPDGRVAGLSKLARTVEVFAAGASDRADCGGSDELFKTQGRYGDCGSGAYVHDHARRQKTGDENDDIQLSGGIQ